MRASRTPFRTLLAALAATCLGSFPVPAPAATAQRMDLQALTASADLVVRGAVLHASTRKTPEGRIVTDTVFQVAEVLSGEAGGDTLVVTTLGGEIGDEGQIVPGSPELGAGEELVLFLRRPGPVSALARTFVVGLGQGVFHVRRASGRPILARHLDDMVLTGFEALPVPGDLDGLRDSLRTIEDATSRPGVPR